MQLKSLFCRAFFTLSHLTHKNFHVDLTLTVPLVTATQNGEIYFVICLGLSHF